MKENKKRILMIVIILVIIIITVIGISIYFINRNRQNKFEIEEVVISYEKLIEKEEPLIAIIEDIQEPEIQQEPELVENKIEIARQYLGFETVGKIEIPKTGVDMYVLSKVTVKGLEQAPCLLYATGELNKSGNNLIVGHNYRNGKLFSNNQKLEIGDKIIITNLEGEQKEYTVYSKFITDPEDVSYLKRETPEGPEITLSSCTDDNINRVIILAK